MNDAGKGVLAITVAACIWGLSPLLYKALSHVPPMEVLSHRTLWGMVFFLCILTYQNRLGQIPPLFRPSKELAMMLVATLMIATNWLIFITAIQLGFGVEAGLGYYIFPLLMVLVGVLAFGEVLTRWRMLAIGLATCAVVTLTLGLGVAPYIALALSSSFAVYGVLKKQITAGPVLSVCFETMAFAPITIVVLIGAHGAGWGADNTHQAGVFGSSVRDTGLLLLSGPVTALPLFLMSYASKRVSLATVGLVQYLNPSLQICVAVFVFSEVFTQWHVLAFSMIWVALAIYSIESLALTQRQRRQR